MRSSILLLASLASAVVAVIPGIPVCAQPCITTFGSCTDLNADCICHSTELISGLACCVGQKCDAADQAATLTFAKGICKAYPDVVLPSAATCAPGASGASSTGSASGSSSSSTSGSTSGSMSTTSAPSSAMSNVATASSGSSTTSSGAAGSTATTGSGTGSSVTAATGSSSSPSATPSNGAVGHGAGLGLLVVGLVAAL